MRKLFQDHFPTGKIEVHKGSRMPISQLVENLFNAAYRMGREDAFKDFRERKRK